MTEFPWSFQLSVLSTLSLQQFVNYSPGFPTPALVPTEVSAPLNSDSLYLPVGLSNYQGSSLSCDLTFLTDLKRTIDFQFIQPVRTKWKLPSFLHVISEPVLYLFIGLFIFLLLNFKSYLFPCLI